MTNHSSAAQQEAGPDAPQRPVRRQWQLTVTAVRDLTPHMRRIDFTGDELKTFVYKPGQDVVIYFPTAENPNRRRHYTVSRFDAAGQRLSIDFLQHGEGPGAQWAASAKPGDVVMLSGPVTRHEIDPEADWYLFAGDDTALPAISSMLAALPAGKLAYALIEVAGPEEEQPIESKANLQLRWLHRGDTPGQESELLLNAVAALELPSGRADVFLAGETGRMRALRRSLIERGVLKEQIFAMGYWRPGRFGGDETIRDE